MHYQPIVQVSDGRMTGSRGAAALGASGPRAGATDRTSSRCARRSATSSSSAGGSSTRPSASSPRCGRRYPHSDQLSMAINVSARQLRDERLCDHVARAMVKYNLPAERAVHRDHRVVARREPERHLGHARHLARLRRAHRDRRLRHRLFVAGLPAAAARGRDQDRSPVHHEPRPGPLRRQPRRRHPRHGQLARVHVGGRRRRDRPAALRA